MNISTDSPNSSSLAMGEPQKIVMDVQVPVEHVINKSDSCNTTSPSSTTSISYWRLLIDYPMYRYFLLSYIVTQLGEWLTYVASLSILELASTAVNTTIEDVIVESASTISPAESLSSIPGIYPEHQEKNHFLISILVVCRLIPTTLSSFFGGMLADTCDRKLIMFRLDVCGGCVAMVYYIMAIQALHTDSSDENLSSTTIVSTTTVIVLLLCTIALSTISGLYLPSRSSIVPMLVGEDKSDNIEKANEMSSIVWSLMAALGSSFGGFIVDHYGVAICFATDTIMYFTSALILMIFVTGNYNVMLRSAEKTSKATTNPSHNVPSINDDTIHVEIDVNCKKRTTTDPNEREASTTKQISQSGNGSNNFGGIRGLLQEVHLFVMTHDSAPYLLIKGCGAILFGASDVIQVTFAQDPETGVLDPQRLGYLFSAVGVGCLLGPILMPPGRCYLSACIGSYYVIALGYGCMAWSKNFWWKCFWTAVRASGTAVLWVDSTILLQTTIPATLLGRISSIDFAIALLGEAASAMFAGLGQDYGLSAQQVSFTLSGVGMFWGVLWTVATIYHRHQHYKKSSKRDLSSVELEPLTMNP